MKKAITDYLPKALVAVEKNLTKSGKVPSTYNGYIASLGASITQMGLLPTLAFFSYSKSKNLARSKEDRPKLINCIFEVINLEAAKAKDGKLLQYAIEEYQEKEGKDLRQLQRQIIHAAIAIKLAIRTFPMDK